MAHAFATAPKSDTDAIYKLASNAHNVKSTTEDAVTLTVAEFINGVYIQSGTPGTSTKTTPTATEIVAAISKAAAGSHFTFLIDNGGDGTLTLGAGDGVTLSGTATVTAAKNRMFYGYVTDADTPAVRVVCGPELA